MVQQQTETILLVEDDPVMAQLCEEYLRRDDYAVTTESLGDNALLFLSQFRPAAIILDLHLPDMNGIQILRHVHMVYPDLPVIVITADTTAKTAIEAMEEGAVDFIQKPFSSARLTVTLRNVLDRRKLEKEIIEWRQTLGQNHYHHFIGQSPAMLAVYRIIDSVSASKASIFITGESGTGKELAACALHDNNPSRAKAFIPINCGAIPTNLLESTLFGHVKGAFTGATQDHIGAAKLADGGTLFLDEVCELPLELQVKLLRFIQSSEITPVGGSKAEKVDIRIIAATNRNPLAEVKAGRFREDLYYRLHVVPLELPPLREREDDVLLLANHFMNQFSIEEGKKFTSLAPDVISLFRSYEWPGNVRQLENVLHSIIAMNDGTIITSDMLPDNLTPVMPSGIVTLEHRNVVPLNGAMPTAAPIKPLWLVEKETIMHTLSYVQQDVQKAAMLLEISPSTLYRKLQAWKSEKVVPFMKEMP